VHRRPIPEATSGRGLDIVRALARHWGVRPVGMGKAVWFEMGTGFGADRAWVPPERAHDGALTTR
jgi:hypothetical protein